MPTTGKLVVLKLDGDLQQQGFQVELEIGSEQERPSIEVPGQLPPNPELVTCLEDWQQTYRSLGIPSRIMPQRIVYGGFINRREECQRLADELRDRLNAWLESRPFYEIDRRLREVLNREEPIRVLIRTRNRDLHRLPWHLWDFIERYPKAEIALSAPRCERIEVARTSASEEKVKILAILGNSTGIDIEKDRSSLETLPYADVTFLVEPKHQNINDRLWDQPWDILFFAGHSETEGERGKIYINSQKESLTIAQLKYGLEQAIAQGLQLAIFNSCDGLGLAYDLEPLHLPQLIVMREPVPDQAAQKFAKYFLNAYANGDSLYLAERKARHRLHGLESEFPCASWLPIIFQNPADVPPTWQTLIGQEAISPTHTHDTAIPKTETTTLAAIVFTDVQAFTEKMAADESHALRLIDRDFQLIERICQQHEGRVLKSLGDGLLLYFVSAERAVACAIAIQTQLAAATVKLPPQDVLKHRIGIHLGEVKFRENDVFGNGVNIAARLQEKAPIGGICLSQTVYDVVKNHLSLPITDGGFHTLKGISNPIHLYWLVPEGAPVPSRRSRVTSSRRKIGLRMMVLTSLVMTGLIMFGRWQGHLQSLELSAYDHLMRQQLWFQQPQRDDRLLVVRITQDDIDRLQQPSEETGQGARTLSDRSLEKLLKTLQQHQPLAIGLDISREGEIDERRYPSLKVSLKSKNLVGICFGRIPSYPTSIKATKDILNDNIGFTMAVLDESDKVIRRYLIWQRINDPTYPCRKQRLGSFSFNLALKYLQTQGITQKNKPKDPFIKIGNTIFVGLQTHQGVYHQASANVDGGIQVIANYRPYQNYATDIAPTVTLTDVLNNQLEKDAVSGKIVLIGADIGEDRYLTPFTTDATIPGVFSIAQSITYLLDVIQEQRPMIWFWAWWIDALWISIWALVGGGIATLTNWQQRMNTRALLRLILLNGVATIFLFAICFVTLFQFGGWIPLVPAVSALVITNTSLVIYRTLKLG